MFKHHLHGVTKHQWPKWIHVAGTDPNNGQPIDKYGCSDGFMHMLLIENTQVQYQTGAAVESFRNEMLKLNGGPGPLLIAN